MDVVLRATNRKDAHVVVSGNSGDVRPSGFQRRFGNVVSTLLSTKDDVEQGAAEAMGHDAA